MLPAGDKGQKPHKPGISPWIISFCLSLWSYMLDVVAISALSVLHLLGVILPRRRLFGVVAVGPIKPAFADLVGDLP